MSEPTFNVEQWLVSDEFLRGLNSPQVLRDFGPWAYRLRRDRGLPTAACLGAWRDRAVREVHYQQALGRLDGALRDRGVPAWLFKGPSLAYRYYESPLDRPYSDLDLLVTPHRWKDFLGVMDHLGAIRHPVGNWAGTRFRQTFSLDGVTVEGHQSLLVGRPLDGWGRRHAAPGAVPGVTWMREFDSALNFVYLCGHGAFQHLFDRLHWLVDLDRLWRHSPPELEAVQTLVRHWRLERAVALSVELLRAHLGTPIPEGVFRVPLWWRPLMPAAVRYLSPERLLEGRHREPRLVYLSTKALLRDSVPEALRYLVSRTLSQAG